MNEVVISAENLGKKYRIGSFKTGDLRNSISNFFAGLNPRTKNKEGYPVHPGKPSPVFGDNYIWALKDISFEIRKGEAVGIIGRNGAGKSTLLKVLSRITDPTTGRFTIDGRVSSLLEVGTGFHPELTGSENIFLNGTILGMRRREIKEKFNQIVEFSGVEKFIDTPVKHYSSGMTVRLAFAVAAHLEPEILIIDEVLAVGDAEFQKKCMGKMDDITRQGRTVLFVSHNLGAVKSLCSHGLLLNGGKLEMNNDIDQVIREYLENSVFDRTLVRKGNGKMHLESLDILDKKDLKTDVVNTFDHLKFRLTYRILEDVKNVTVSLCFNNINNTRVTSLWSAYYNQKFDLERGICVFTFNIPKFKLIPGLYEVILYAEANGDVIERIDNFMQIIVGSATEFQFVQIPTIEQGIYTEEFSVAYTQV